MLRPLLFTLILIGFLIFESRAQFVAQGISYQAVARDVGGNEIINQNLTVRLGIIAGSPSGTAVYEESHDVVTNIFGLFSLQIGQGVLTGVGSYISLVDIPWSAGPYFIKVEVDTPQSVGFVWLGTSELLSVPYAFHALTADSAIEVDGNIENELIDSFQLSNTSIIIQEAGQSFSVDLSPLLGGAGGDGSSNNEIITASNVAGTDLTIEEGVNSSVIDLSGIAYTTWQNNGSSISHSNNPVGVNTNSPSSTFHVEGSYSAAIQTFVAVNDGNMDSYAVDASNQVVICNVTDGDMNVLLPSAVSCKGRIYSFKRFFVGATSAYAVSLSTSFSQTIDGISSAVFNDPKAEYFSVISDGLNWYILSHSKESP